MFFYRRRDWLIHLGNVIPTLEPDLEADVAEFGYGSGGLRSQPFIGEDLSLPPQPAIPERDETDIILRAAGGVAGMDPHRVVGADNRVRVRDIWRYFPHRAVAEIVYPDGAKCTGWLYGKNVVATSGHCISPAAGRQRSLPTIFPAREDEWLRPYECKAKDSRITVDYYRNHTPSADWGLYKLNCNIGRSLGWFGTYYHDGASFTDTPVATSGYPWDSPLPSGWVGHSQWFASGRILESTPNGSYLRHNLDTTGGQSGSPVYARLRFRDGSSGVYSFAFHQGPNGDVNRSVRINRWSFHFMMCFKKGTC